MNASPPCVGESPSYACSSARGLTKALRERLHGKLSPAPQSHGTVPLARVKQFQRCCWTHFLQAGHARFNSRRWRDAVLERTSWRLGGCTHWLG